MLKHQVPHRPKWFANHLAIWDAYAWAIECVGHGDGHQTPLMLDACRDLYLKKRLRTLPPESLGPVWGFRGRLVR